MPSTSDSTTRPLRRALHAGRNAVAWRLAARVAVVAVVAGVVFGTLPFTLGAIGGDAVYTGGPPGDRAVEEPQQRYQNAIASDVLNEGHWLLLFVALAVAFVVGRRSAAARRQTVGGTAIGAAVGIAAGYLAAVGLGHLALEPTPNGFIVPDGPVRLEPWATLGNAVGLAIPAAVGAALTATAGTIAPVGRGDASPSDGRGDDAAPAAPAEADAADDGDGAADDDGTGASTASDVGVTGPAGAPTYDPEGRDWDGADEDSS